MTEMIRGSGLAVNVYRGKFNKLDKRSKSQALSNTAACYVIEVDQNKLKAFKQEISAFLTNLTETVLGFEDDILVGTIESFLLNDANADGDYIDEKLKAKRLEDLVSPFVGDEKTKEFMVALWTFLIKKTYGLDENDKLSPDEQPIDKVLGGGDKAGGLEVPMVKNEPASSTPSTAALSSSTSRNDRFRTTSNHVKRETSFSDDRRAEKHRSERYEARSSTHRSRRRPAPRSRSRSRSRSSSDSRHRRHHRRRRRRY